jgi:hypothetical protein
MDIAEPPLAPARDPDFVVARGMHYLDFLKLVHRRVRPSWYLEIGTNRGRSLEFVTCASVAIDPRFKLEAPSQGPKPALIMLQQTSDDAFGGDILRRLDPRFDIAFLDGMHRFEFLLRDFINAERLMAPGGLIFMHDTSPKRHAMTVRNPTKAGPWTGDVWKLLPILAEYRPDLRIDHLDCKATGLTLVRGPWGGNDALTRNYDAILERFTELSLDAFGVKAFFEAFPHVPSATFLDTL